MVSVCPACQTAPLEASQQDPQGKRVMIRCTNPLCLFRELVLNESCCE